MMSGKKNYLEDVEWIPIYRLNIEGGSGVREN